ncbi:hypothetical protein FRC10_011405 [Ceratobasidium sp. 414]|nr:hypothetical protein FRC10_011405 [Ceratobasidium sp. 414]
MSTARTSLASASTPTEFRSWPLTNTPESPAPRRTSLLPITEHAHPVTVETEVIEFIGYLPSIDDVGLTREARPVPVQAYRAVPVSRAPAQTRPAQVDLGLVQADLVQAPAPTRAGPRPAPVQSGPAPVAQPNPAIPVDPVVQAGPVPPAVQPGPTVQFHPATTQVYPTASVGPAVRATYPPEIRARLAAAQARAHVEAPPAAQTYLTATQAYPSVQVDSVPRAYSNRPRQKKGVMQQIMAFFCCGSSNQMSG